MKIYAVLTYSLTVILLALLYRGTHHPTQTATIRHQSVSAGPCYSIGVLSPFNGVQIEAIISRYHQELSEHPDFNWKIKIYDAKGDHTLLNAMAEESLQKKHDILYSIGTAATKTLIVKTNKRKSHPPLLFSNIFSSAWQAFVDEDPLLPNRITGSIASYEWDNRIKTLKLLFPYAKKILIPHPALKSDGVHTIREAQRRLQEVGIKAIILPIETQSDLLPRLKAHLPDVDVLMLIRESLMFNAIDLFISLADRYHVPVYASDTDAAYKGAAVGEGIDETIAGTIVAEQTVKILRDKKSVHDVPIENLDERGSLIVFNSHSIKQHNLPVDPRVLFLVRNGFVDNTVE